MEMWSSFNTKKNMDLMRDSIPKREEWTLWQSSTQGRMKWTGVIVDCEEKITKLEITSGNIAEIRDLEPIFAHLPKKDIIFKRDKYQKSDSTLTFKTPTEIKIKERRSQQRFYFKYQDYKSVSFKYKHSDKENIANYTLVDLSTSGLAYVITQAESLKFQVDQEIILTHITDQQLPSDHKAKIISINRFKLPEGLKDRTNASELTRIGVKYIESLESVTYKSIGSIIDKRQTKLKGIQTEGFNGLSDEEQLKILSKVREDNPALASNLIERIEELDHLRYLTNQMKQIFWTEVKKELLATALRLSSKELIFELLGEVTDNIKNEFLELINQPKPPAAINKAQDEICKYIREKEKAGEFVLDPTSFIKYV